MKKVRRVVSFIIVLSMFMLSLTSVYAQITDIDTHWAKNEINYLVEKGILTGYPDGTFKPENNVSKVEFYKIINNTMGYKEEATFEFKDVRSPEEDWFYYDVSKAVKAGYITDGEFLYPTEFITREEVARIIGVTFKLNENPEFTAYFKDNLLISLDALGFIGTLKEKEYIIGFPDETFRPTNSIKRAELVKMLYNILVIEGIPQKADLTKYKAALAAVNESDYTKHSWAAYQNIVLANVVTEDNTQDEVDAATETIINAQKELVKVYRYKPVVPEEPEEPEEPEKPEEPVIDKIELAAKISEAERLNEEDYTAETWTVLETALGRAIEVNNNTEATQEQVNEALTALEDAIQGLEEKQEEPVVDKTALTAKISEAERLNEEDYTAETWTVLETALGRAIEVNNNTEATQEQVNEALTALEDAIQGLEEKQEEPVVDKTALTAKISEAERLNEEDYTAETWTVLETALGRAIEVNNNTEATQEQVNEALTALEDAIQGLEEKQEEPVVDKTALTAKISEAERLNEEDYTAETWTVLETALGRAIEVNNNTEATQEQVNEALTALEDAIQGLEEKQEEPVVDKTALTAKISEAERLNEEDYTAETWTVLETALGRAIEVNNNTEATQEQVNEALTALEDAIQGLEEKQEEPVVDKTALAAKISEAERLNEEDYTAETWTVLETALGRAIEVNNNTEATQEQVNEALTALEDAIQGLEEKQEEPVVDKTALTAKISEAEGLNEEDYTPETWTVLETALGRAIEVNNNTEATQEQVNEALTVLENAIQGLEEKQEEPVVVATYHPQLYMPTIGKISVEVNNVTNAVKFSVTYHLSPDEQGNEVIRTTEIIDINTPLTTEGYPIMFYNPSTTGYDTITICIYDANENLLYTFESVVPVTAR
ncbi:FIVAR domain-containing protein [Sedimentibacter sp. zth1]|uniref:S-layer homology domain-containing protein n=1 Tax=Sedimentibacter sp. zth1 TaxID=2816908 RepID=UPI001A91015F|nr:S-layer homology domain-containing protein [Sedimentibacter sp. zth1]QSX05985.1 FIVAR domain-containing protein [Sedimentibacter sp. zth1]